jgi:hypothetical protein
MCPVHIFVLLSCRLSRGTFITIGEDGSIPRCKLFKYTYEKEIVIYHCYAISQFFHVLLCLAYQMCFISLTEQHVCIFQKAGLLLH